MNPHRKFILFVVILLLASLACTSLGEIFDGDGNGGTIAGTQPPTAEGSEDDLPSDDGQSGEDDEPRRRVLAATPTPFQVTNEDDPRRILNLSDPDHFDYFDGENFWYDIDRDDKAGYRVEDGELIGVDYEPEELNTWWSYNRVTGGNVYAEVTATNGECIDKDAVGMAVRVDSQTASAGYAFEVSCDGNWRLVRLRVNKEPVEMVDWTESEAINTGEFASNRLGIWAYQRDFVLFVNGEQVGEARDPAYSLQLGAFALYVKGFLTFDLSASFDDFAFWEIPFQQ